MFQTKTTRMTALYAIALCLAFSLFAGQCRGEIGRQMHPWGRFELGAWKVVRVATETFDANGSIRSVTETKTTLSNTSDKDVTLEVEVSVEVAGKEFDAEPQEVRQAFNGEPVDNGVVVTELPPGEVEIQDAKIPCRVQQVASEGPAGKTVAQVYYSETVAPYILKRQSTTTDAAGEVVSETTWDVIALDVPVHVPRRGLCQAAHVKLVQKSGKATTTTLAVVCPDVPGGVICHSLKELDNSGRVVRSGRLELIAYGLTTDWDDRGEFFHRRRVRSARKPPRLTVPR